MKYGDVVKIKPIGNAYTAPAIGGRFMVVGPVERYDRHTGPKVTAVCLEPPSRSWHAGEIGGIWIDQCEEVK